MIELATVLLIVLIGVAVSMGSVLLFYWYARRKGILGGLFEQFPKRRQWMTEDRDDRDG